MNKIKMGANRRTQDDERCACPGNPVKREQERCEWRGRVVPQCSGRDHGTGPSIHSESCGLVADDAGWGMSVATMASFTIRRLSNVGS